MLMRFPILPATVHSLPRLPKTACTPAFLHLTPKPLRVMLHTLCFSRNTYRVLSVCRRRRSRMGKLLGWYKCHTNSKSQVLTQTGECGIKAIIGELSTRERSGTWQFELAFILILHHSLLTALLSVIVQSCAEWKNSKRFDKWPRISSLLDKPLFTDGKNQRIFEELPGNHSSRKIFMAHCSPKWKERKMRGERKHEWAW